MHSRAHTTPCGLLLLEECIPQQLSLDCFPRCGLLRECARRGALVRGRVEVCLLLTSRMSSVQHIGYTVVR